MLPDVVWINPPDRDEQGRGGAGKEGRRSVNEGDLPTATPKTMPLSRTTYAYHLP